MTIHSQPFASNTLNITSKLLLSLFAAILRLFIHILKAWDNVLVNLTASSLRFEVPAPRERGEMPLPELLGCHWRAAGVSGIKWLVVW